MTNHENIVSKYVNLDVLCGTLVECERLFSVAKNILTDTRKGTSPAVFQALLWSVKSQLKGVGRLHSGENNPRCHVGGDGVYVGEVANDHELYYEEEKYF